MAVPRIGHGRTRACSSPAFRLLRLRRGQTGARPPLRCPQNPAAPPPPAAPRAAIGRLCEKCDGKCPICDSYVRPATLVRVCDECNYGSYEGRCVICGGVGVSDAYYCKECTLQEKDVGACGRRAGAAVRVDLPGAAAGPASKGARAQARTQCCEGLCAHSARADTQPLHASPAPPPRPGRAPLHPTRAQRDGCPKIINLGSAKTE
jgi:hypothetical protein